MRMSEPTSDAEVEAFENWIRSDPAHSKAYDALEPVSLLGSRLPHRLLDQPRRHWSSRLRPAFAYAAVVVLLLGGGFWLTSQGARPAYAAVSNPGPAVRGVRLTDGTEVVLDSGTKLSISFERDARNVVLHTGRARFSVAPNTDRQFSLASAAVTITASDTMFDVAIDGNVVTIFVLNGLVNVQATKDGGSFAKSAALRSGQAVTIDQGAFSEAPSSFADRRWPASQLAFENAPLARVVSSANRRGSPKIALGDAAISALRVTGVLDIRDTRALARKLAATYDLRIDERAGEIVLTR